jgi:hypothetical protein
MMAEKDVRINGVVVEVDDITGRANAIRRVCEVVEETRT